MAETILAKLAVEVTAKATQFGKVLGDQEKALTKFQNSVQGVSNSLKGALGAISVGLIGREIIEVTSNFQRFEAVLTNTLGSSSEAQKSLKTIQDFAAKTPFSVQQLTGAFVKLANQGFKPTVGELTKLGDLASSTGKDFDQLTEAIIDAQTGEFERLKEFGIRAQKQGDQVKFTFKGVETQTKFTASSIRDYILSLGEAEGVSGAMAAISQTLGGRISNLGDAWDKLLLTIGSGTSGPLNAAIESLAQIVNVAANLNNELELRLASYGIKNLKDLSDETANYALQVARLDGDKLVRDIIAPFQQLSNGDLFGNATKHLRDFVDTLVKEGATVEEATFLWKAYIKQRVEAAKNDQDAAKSARLDAVLAAKAQAQAAYDLANSLGIIESIEAKLKDLEESKKKAFTTGEVIAFNEQIAKLREELDLLNASRALSTFGKKQLDNAKRGVRTELPEEGNGFNRTVDTQGLDEFQLPPIEPPDMTAFQEAFAVIKKTYEETGMMAFNYGEQARLANELDAESRMKAADAAAEYGSIVGDALGNALSGQQSFASAMKKLTADLLKTFLARALGGIIASAATAGGPPPVAIALAAAGVAAISAMFAKIGGSGGGSVSGSLPKPQGSNVSRASNIGRIEDRIIFEGTLVAKGNDLVYVMNNVNNKKGRTG